MKLKSEKIDWLIFTAIFICAIIIGYNAFYTPQAREVKILYESSVESSEKSEIGIDSHFENGKLNINLATKEELAQNLDSISTKLAEKIIEYRSKNGSFKDISEIMNVSGIGEKRFELIKDKICVSAS